jgi:GNAT superfamily N-acetyltransferase
MIIRLLKEEDRSLVREFYRHHAGDETGSLADQVLDGLAGAGAFDREIGVLALGFMRATDLDRYELVDIRVRADHAGMGLDNQLLLTLELTAEKRRARWFGVWLKSDVCGDFGLPDINERLRYIQRGYVFAGYRADFFGAGVPGDRFERELKDVLAEESGRTMDVRFSNN